MRGISASSTRLPLPSVSKEAEPRLWARAAITGICGGGREKVRANPGKSRQSCFKIKCILFFVFFSCSFPLSNTLFKARKD